MIVKVEVMAYNIITLIRLVSITRINPKIMPTNNINYNFHIKAVKHVQPIIWGSYRATSYW